MLLLRSFALGVARERLPVVHSSSPARPGLSFCAALVAVACGGLPSEPDPGELAGGALAEFEVIDERFRIWVTNPETIQQLFDVRDGRSQASIPIGPVRLGPGRAEHNLPWSWHIDPEQVAMAEFTIELCDGKPSFLEEDVEGWIETVGSYCPWSARLVSVRDFR